MKTAYGRIIPAVLFLSLYLPYSYAGTSLSWEDCLRQAAKNSPDLISAREKIEQSRAAQNVVGSGFYPQLSADLSAGHSDSDYGGATSENDSYSYGVSGSQLVFDGFKKTAKLKAAGENLKSSRETFRFTSAQVRYNLRAAFINLLNAQQQVDVQREIVIIRAQDTALIKLRYESGLEHKGAVLTAQASLAEAEFELNRARNDLVLRRHALARLIGLGAEIDFSVSCDCGQNVTIDPVKPDFEALASRHPGFLRALANKNSAAFGIDGARADFWPQASFNAGISKNGSKWLPENRQSNYGVGVSMPLFEGGLLTAQVAQAKASYKQAVADQRAARDEIVIAMEEAWMNLLSAADKVNVQEKVLAASVERSRIAEAQYSAGFISFDNWVLIQNDLVQAKRNYLSAKSGALSAQAAWQFAKGETLDYE